MPSTLIAIILVTLPVLADPPAGYYDTVDESSAEQLRQTLHDIIDDHNVYSYGYTILNEADQDPDSTGSILDVYKNATYPKHTSGDTNYNREHVWPNSYGFPSSGLAPYTDYHHLMASDTTYNSSRGNRPFAYCDSGCQELVTLDNHGVGGGGGDESNWRTQSIDGSSGSWETWIGKRGDVARAVFYMDVRYEGDASGEADLRLTDDRGLMVTGTLNVAYMGLLSVLLEWNHQDPPDAFEMNRNDVVYSWQGNRNPFIDNYQWADCIFSGVCGSEVVFVDGFETGGTGNWSLVTAE